MLSFGLDSPGGGWERQGNAPMQDRDAFSLERSTFTHQRKDEPPMSTPIAKRFWMAALALTLLSGSAQAGSWFEEFDGFADQTAYDASTDWTGAGGKTKGTLSTEHALANGKSLLCQQAPTESRPTRDTHDGDDLAVAGRVDAWFYDDGADIKAFDVAVANGVNSIAVGLRDAAVGSDTPYTCNINGTVTDTPVMRTMGWHLIQIAVHGTSGASASLDSQTWAGNSLPALVAADTMTIYTNFGNATDENKVWVDSLFWDPLDDDAYVPHSARVAIVEDFKAGLGNWTAPANIALHHITDDGAEEEAAGTGQCMDANADSVGPRRAEGLFPAVIPARGSYRVDFAYMNGPDWGGPNRAWPNLNVSFQGHGGSGFVSLGSAPVTGFTWGQTSAATMLAGSDLTIVVAGDDEATPPGSAAEMEFIRIDKFYLYINQFEEAPLGATNWAVYE